MGEINEKTKQVRLNIERMQDQIKKKEQGLKLMNAYIEELKEMDLYIKQEK